jgi:ribosomal protein S18 acetylase RimI-like enzyme
MSPAVDDDPVLRPATPQDAGVIGAYHHRCWTVGYRGLLPDEVLDGLHPADRQAQWQQILDAGDRPTTVVTSAGRVVGHVLVDDDTITNVYVDPEVWRRGLGRVLLREGERLLAEAGVRDAYLWTLVGNDRAVALYESEGWALDGVVEEHVGFMGVTLEEMRMRKVLEPQP